MKKLITILAVLALLVSTIALVTVSAATEETVYSGTCGADGDNLTWTLDTATGELVISGEGAMATWRNYADVPWYAYLSSIRNVTIKNGVTSIGDFAFCCSYHTSVTIPNSVTSIGDYAFNNCINLTSVKIPNSVTSIGDYAFELCTSLTNIEISNSITSIGIYPFSVCPIKDITFCGTDAQWAVIASNFHEGFSVSYHTWDPTHTTDGVKTFTCSICGETIYNLPEHEYGSWGTHNATQHIKFCPCGDIQYADHAWNEGVVTTAPTHLADGQKTYTCSDCGETKFETVAKTTEHTYGEWGKHNADKHAKVCACGDTVYADHAWDNGVITTAPTHLADGQKTYTCSDCGETKFETVAKTTEHTYGEWGKHNADKHAKVCACGDVVYANHAWDNGVITTAPTHLADGQKTYTCTDCGETKFETVAKTTEHTYGEWGKHNADKHAKVCACGDVVYANHAWDNGVVTTAPTHLADGQKTYTCSDCGETKFETVAKTTEHTYGEWGKHNAD
ncbi:MAG: leucine-rich repeat domain-containing protein, partial [Clostridia bacterium]|nr:leucine-rich repeat domain-containing protein [Clostridia bacterium]